MVKDSEQAGSLLGNLVASFAKCSSFIHMKYANSSTVLVASINGIWTFIFIFKYHTRGGI